MEDTGGSIGRCNGTATRLFPYNAASESQWLAITDRFLYEHGERAAVERAVVETGTTCASANRCWRTLMLYRAQCMNSATCQAMPSVPYRRLAARHSLHIELWRDQYCTYPRDGVLHNVSASRPAFLRRCYVDRNNEACNSGAGRSSELRAFFSEGRVAFLHAHTCILQMRGRACRNDAALLQTRCHRRSYQYTRPGSRAAVLLTSHELLTNDNVQRVVVSESVGCAVSCAHFLLRNAILRRSVIRDALTKLGGPMSQ